MPQLASQTSAGRSQMALDNPMFMSFQNQLIRPATIHGIPQIPNNSHFNFNALPIPPNLSPNLGPTHGSNKSQRVNPTTESLITPARAARRRATTLGVGAHAGGGAGVRYVEYAPRLTRLLRGTDTVCVCMCMCAGDGARGVGVCGRARGRL